MISLDLFGLLGVQALVVIGGWYPRATINQSVVLLCAETIPKVVQPKA